MKLGRYTIVIECEAQEGFKDFGGALELALKNCGYPVKFYRFDNIKSLDQLMGGLGQSGRSTPSKVGDVVGSNPTTVKLKEINSEKRFTVKKIDVKEVRG